MTRLARLVLATALAVAGTVAPAAAAHAAPASACSTSTGVLVVVDFRALGGNVQRGCDPDPSTGYDALHTAGFDTTGTQHDGPGFVCRIDGRPTPQQDPCVRTPPASAYWSYWHANAGQSSWSYSTRGAMSYEPKPGSVDAWVFGATDVGGTSGGPCFTPADARAGRARSCASSAPPRTKPRKTSAPRRTSAAPRRSATRAIDPPGRTPSTTGTAPTARTSTSRSATASPSASGSTTTQAAAPTTAVSSAAPSIVDASPAAGSREGGGGSATPVVIGSILALLLAAAAGYTALRRRRMDADRA